MIAGYLETLRTPGALRVFLPALVGRMAFAMVTLALLYSVQSSTGSFAIAGAATGAFGISNVVASPHRARFVDRMGQRIALGSLSAAFAMGLGGLALATTVDAPAWLLVVIAGLIGLFPPPLGASMRVIWSSLADPGPARTRAYSIDAVCEEVLFTTGPLIAAAIISASSPATALLVTACIAVIGTVGMTSSGASKERVARRASGLRGLRPLKQPGFAPVLVALLAVGTVLGTVEIAVPAVAEGIGSVELAGILLAAFAAGSAIGGLLYGQRTWRASLSTRLLLAGTTMALLSAGAALLSGILALALVLVAVGFFLAPSLITGYLYADHLTAEEVRTEASSWINTAVNAGAAGAAIAVGSVVDVAEPQTGFLVGAGIALALLVLATPGLLSSGRRTDARPLAINAR